MKPNKFKHAVYDWLASKHEGFEFIKNDIVYNIEDLSYTAMSTIFCEIAEQGLVELTGKSLPSKFKCGAKKKVWRIINFQEIKRISDQYNNHDFSRNYALAELRRLIRNKIKKEYQETTFKTCDFYSIAEKLGLEKRDVSGIVTYDAYHGKGIKIVDFGYLDNGRKFNIYAVMDKHDYSRQNEEFEDRKINILTPKIPDLDSIIFGMGR